MLPSSRRSCNEVLLHRGLVDYVRLKRPLNFLELFLDILIVKVLRQAGELTEIAPCHHMEPIILFSRRPHSLLPLLLRPINNKLIYLIKLIR